MMRNNREYIPATAFEPILRWQRGVGAFLLGTGLSSLAGGLGGVIVVFRVDAVAGFLFGCIFAFFPGLVYSLSAALLRKNVVWVALAQWLVGTALGLLGEHLVGAGRDYTIQLMWLGQLLGAVIALVFLRSPPRHPAGHCQSCGYNLFGLTEPRCPECGTSFHPTDVPTSSPQ